MFGSSRRHTQLSRKARRTHPCCHGQVGPPSRLGLFLSGSGPTSNQLPIKMRPTACRWWVLTRAYGCTASLGDCDVRVKVKPPEVLAPVYPNHVLCQVFLMRCRQVSICPRQSRAEHQTEPMSPSKPTSQASEFIGAPSGGWITERPESPSQPGSLLIKPRVLGAPCFTFGHVHRPETFLGNRADQGGASTLQLLSAIVLGRVLGYLACFSSPQLMRSVYLLSLKAVSLLPGEKASIQRELPHRRPYSRPLEKDRDVYSKF